MANIHIGISPYHKKKKLVKVQIYFHVPNNKANNSFPGVEEILDNAGNPIPVSVAPGILATELTALKNGTLIEIRDAKFYNLADASAQVIQEIKEDVQSLWQPIADKKQIEMDRDYRFYGTLLAKAP